VMANERGPSGIACESGEDGSENPRVPMRGMGGATAVRLIATAARQARTRASSTAQPLPHVPPLRYLPPSLFPLLSLQNYGVYRMVAKPACW